MPPERKTAMARNKNIRQTHDPMSPIETAPIPAAQYLRMSRESQAYSLENQQITNQQWGFLHGFVVTKTYADPGKSGVVIKNREGLQGLLNDVASGHAPFRAVLVYDVSRWGRFQDMDEAAHYEYICKSAGIPVYYCAEAFSLESTMPNLILKALKRTMAAEYSRDLSDRTYVRQRNAAEKGFWMCATPGYGLRRMLVDVNGKPKHKMKFGERKALQSDRVRIVLGPRTEVECVREIFQMVIRGRGKVGPKAIARELNQRGFRHFGKEWTGLHVDEILSNPKYCGQYIWGKRTSKLHGRRRWTELSERVICNDAIPPIVDKKTFEKAQAIRPGKTDKTTCEALLRRCKGILRTKGHISEKVFDETPGSPSAATLYRYFHDLWNLYRQLNYEPEPERSYRDAQRQRSKRLRDEVLNAIAASCPKHIDVIEPAPNHRRMLLIDRVLPVSVLLCRSFRNTRRSGWIVMPHARERDNVTLLCLQDENNTSVVHYFLSISFPRRGCYIKFDTTEEWLKSFRSVDSLSELYWAVWEVQGEKAITSPKPANKRYSKFWTPQVVKQNTA